MAGAYDILVKVGADISNFSKEMKRTSDSLAGFSKETNKNSLTVGKLVGALGIAAAGAKAFGMAKESLNKAFSRIDTMEQFERVMTTMTGSSEKANEVLQTVNDTVTGTAYGLDVGAKAVQNFVTSNMDVDKATDAVAAWGDAVSFYGDGSNQTFASVTDALAQMTAKGKVQMDTMNRLSEAGIPAMQIFADATGQSVEEVAAQMQKGELSAEQFNDVMIKALEDGTQNFEGIKGAAKEAGASWSGSFDNMRAAVARGITAIIQGIDEMLTSNGLPDMREMVAIFGKKFEEVLKKVGETIPPIIERIIQIKRALEPWMPLITGIVAAALTFATIVAVINTVKNAFTFAKAAVMLFNATLLANPVALVIAAIIGLAVIIYKYWDEIKAITIIAWNAIKEFFISLWDSIKSIFSEVYAWLNAKTNGAFGEYLSIISNYFNMVWGVIKDVWSYIKQTFSNVLAFLKALVKGDFQGMKNAIQAQMENARQLISNIWGRIRAFFGDVLSRIWTLVKNKFSDMVSSIREKMNDVKSRIEDGWNRAKAFLEGIDLLQIGKDVIQGFIDGIKSKVSDVAAAAKDAADAVTGKIKSILGIKSPSRVLMRLGQFTAEGMAKGIEDSKSLVESAADSLATAATPTMAYTTPSGSYSTLAGAVNGTLEVSTSENNRLLAEISRKLDRQQQMIIEMDGREFGRAVSETVSGQRSQSTRGRGHRRI